MSQANTPRHSVSVAAAVIKDGRFLAVRRHDNGHWEPPGGVLELDEGVEDGLRREVMEETGLEVTPLLLTGVYKNMKRGIVALVFRCAITGGELTARDETDATAWLTPDEVRGRMDEAYAVRLLDALHDTPSVRSHDGTKLL